MTALDLREILTTGIGHDPDPGRPGIQNPARRIGVLGLTSSPACSDNEAPLADRTRLPTDAR